MASSLVVVVASLVALGLAQEKPIIRSEDRAVESQTMSQDGISLVEAKEHSHDQESDRIALFNVSVQSSAPPLPRVPVVDLFIFNDELEMLKIRLAEHNDFTDLFILIECSRTFMNAPKPLHATLALKNGDLDKWKDKLVIASFDPDQRAVGRFQIENQTRTFAETTLRKLVDKGRVKPQSVVAGISDVDEIFDGSRITEAALKIKEGTSRLLPLHLHYYNLHCVRSYLWSPSRLKLFHATDPATGLNNVYVNEGSDIVFGWHMSYFMTPQEANKKLHDFSHAGDSFVAKIQDHLDVIKARIDSCTDLFLRKKPLRRMSDDEFALYPKPRVAQQSSPLYDQALARRMMGLA